MVAVPRGADQFVNARRAEASGAAVRLVGDDFTTDAVRNAVRSVLTEDGFRDAALGLAREISMMPTPAAIVAAL
jgi:UDP:flavonoid glycosyltransferase YjiC (YdhE family)